MRDEPRWAESGMGEGTTRLGWLTRRRFLALGLGAVAGWLASCRGAGPTLAPEATLAPAADTPDLVAQATEAPVPASPTSSAPPTATPGPTQEPSPTATARASSTHTPPPATATQAPTPTATAIPYLDREGLTAHWPETGTSRVVIVRHGQVWSGDQPEPAIVLEMLDAGLRELADHPDAFAVWQTLFDPGERVLLKVNCIAYGGPTQPAVSCAVAQRLQDAGLKAQDILIFDRTDHELSAAGYALNEGGPGVQCHGTRGDGGEVRLSQATVRFFQELEACQAIVNLPTPKQHGTAGISVSLKNHFGSINRPGSLHGNRCDPSIAELNAQPTLRDKTRLVVGAALQVSPRDWNLPERENALLLSFDPVALDTVARDILVRHREAQGLGTARLIEGATHLATAQELGLGATEAQHIDLREVTLG